NGKRRATSGPTLVCEHCGFNGETIDLFEDDLGVSSRFHWFYQGDKRVATFENDSSMSKGGVEDMPDTEPIQNIENQPLRRSERSSVFLNKYNEYVVDSRVKFGTKRFVSYENLNFNNFCFTIELYKAFEPKTYWQACKEQHWIEAMNKEMDVLYGNDTWDITELPSDRKAIGSKWVYKIKYKLNGETERYKATLVAKGFNQKESKSDYSLFTKSYDTDFLDLLVYVDDIIVTRNNNHEIEKFKEFLKSKFIKDLRKLKYFFSIEVVDTNNEYQKLIGKLIYLTHSRPDIAYFVHCLSQFMHKPLKSHLKIAFKVLRYFKGSLCKGIHITKSADTSLKVYVDVDWAKCVLEFFVIAKLQAAIKIAANPAFHERTKHLEFNLRFVRDKIISGVIETKKISSADQRVDVLTKGLDKTQHEKLILIMGIYDMFQ
ncbi:ribonuclease H-like domain-containing protein, partial [Tanacetum coccineum]